MAGLDGWWVYMKGGGKMNGGSRRRLGLDGRGSR